MPMPWPRQVPARGGSALGGPAPGAEDTLSPRAYGCWLALCSSTGKGSHCMGVGLGVTPWAGGALGWDVTPWAGGAVGWDVTPWARG